MNRRWFLGVFAAAPVAAGAIAKEVANPAKIPIPPIRLSQQPYGEVAADRDPYKIPGYREARNRLRALGHVKDIHKGLVIAPDIDALKSVPACTKMRMQIKRDLQYEREMSALEKAAEAIAGREFNAVNRYYELLGVFGESDD